MKTQTLADAERLALARKLYEVVSVGTESFGYDDIGADLAYLLGAILGSGSHYSHDFVDWSSDAMDSPPVLLQVLQRHYSETSPIWQFIKL